MPPLLFGVLNDVTQSNERADALNRGAMAESRSAQDRVALITGGVQRLLFAVADAPPIRATDHAACSLYLGAIAGKIEEYTLLAAADLNGDVICNNEGVAQGAYSVAKRAYFRRALATGKFASGDLVTGLTTHRQSLHFATPFRGLDGAVTGVAIVSVDQEWLAAQLADETTPPGAEVIMFDPSGIIVAAAQDGAPIHAEWVGQLAPQALLDALTVTTAKVVEMRGPDGMLRLFGAVPPNPVLLGNRVVVGVDRNRAFTDLRAASMRNLLGLGLGGLVALLAGVLTARRFVLGPLARIAHAANRVGAGDLNARADLGAQAGEFHELGAGFDRMITALAAREQERDRAEAELRRQEARLQLALEAGGLGSFEWDLTRDIIEPSETAQAMFGFGPEEGRVSSDYFARMVPEDRAQARADIAKGITAGRVVHSYRITRDGERRYILVQAEVVHDGDGNPSLIGLIADETERLENVFALRESEARFEAIVNCIDQMVWSTRPDGYHDYFNQRWYEFTGTKPGTTDGTSWIGVFHPDDHDETERIWRASLATGQPYHREYRLRHVSGQYRWVLGRAQAIRDETGRIVRWYGTCTDIDEIIRAREVLARSREALTREIADRTAELMAAEEQLRQSQKMEAVGQLTGGIAHDFNNMLQAIGGALELLVRRVEQDKLEEAKRFAGVARSTVDRAAALTHRLLAFARRQTLTPEAVDPTTLVDGMAELVARTVGPAIEVVTRHADGTWTVLCDLSQLENVVFNLCINARDAMPGGGKLTIATRNVTLSSQDIARGEGAAPGDYVEVAVTDTGVGMDEATRARAFEPFFTTKPVGQGTGLGLSQVYGFVRQSGGFVRLESEPGAGTTVRLHLPRHRTAAQTLSSSPSSSDVHILLVEDDAATRQATAEHFESLGYRVHRCADGGQAMFLLSTGVTRLDVLVTEIGLPGNVNGRQIAEAARQHQPYLPVLFITGYTGGRGDDGELAPGMSIISKPFTPQALAARIRALLPATAPA